MPSDDDPTPSCCTTCPVYLPAFARKWWDEGNGLTIGVLFIYFLNAFIMTFPMLANQEWLYDVLKMDQSTLSNYYGVIMIPWSMKPFYAMLLERVPILGYHRRPWLVVGSLITAGSFLLNAYVVRSAGAAFASGFLQMVGLALVEIICGGAVMDAAHRNMKNAGAIQSRTTTARALGSFAASAIHLYIYPCEEVVPLTPSGNETFAALEMDFLGGAEPEVRLTWKKVMLVSGAAAALMSFCLFQTPEPPAEDLARLQSVEIPGRRRSRQSLMRKCSVAPTNQKDSPSEDSDIEECTELIERQKRRRLHSLSCYVLAIVFTLECVLVWVTLKGLVHNYVLWRGILIGSACVAPIIIALIVWRLRKVVREMRRESSPRSPGYSGGDSASELSSSDASEDVVTSFVDTLKQNKRIIVVALFLFLMNATPSAVDQLASMNYSLFRKCDLTRMSLAGYGTKVFAAWVYHPIANSHSIRWVLPGMMALATAASLLAIPLTQVEVPTPLEKYEGNVSDVDFFGSRWNLLAYGYFSTLVGAFFSRLALIPTEVLAVEQSPYDARLLYYAMFLACYDSGSSIRGWISAPIVNDLDITYTDYSNLYKLIWISAATQLCVALMAPGVMKIGKNPAKKMVNNNDESDGEDDAAEGKTLE